MDWFFLALAAPVVFTIVNYIDKYVVTREVPDARAMPIYAAIMALVAAVLLALVADFSVITSTAIVVLLISGVVNTWGAALYFIALQTEETSSIIVMMQTVPIYVLVLAAIFLGETITGNQFVGFVLVLVAALGVSLRQGGTSGLRLSRAFWLIALVNLLRAINAVMFRAVAVDNDFAATAAIESFGMLLGGVSLYLFLPPIRRAFNDSIRSVRRHALGVIALNEMGFLTGKLLTFAAIVAAPAVALVSVLGGTQVFFGILVGWLLTVAAPAIFREDITRANLLRKGALAVLLFVGITMIN